MTTEETGAAPEPEGVEPEEGVEGPAELVTRAEAEASLAKRQGRPDYRLAMEMGQAMAASGYFQDAKAEAQAAVKMIIGLDLGVSPTAAMSAIHIVEGKPQIGYQILAAKIREHPHYGYRIDQHDDERCVVVFTDNRLGTPAVEEDPGADPPVFARDANEIDRVEWTIARANEKGISKGKQGNTKANWKRYPRNMLIARCFSDGVKWHMPDLITGAAVYVEGELDERPPLMPERKVERPPALVDDRAEALRAQVRQEYDRLRVENPELLAPGAFNKLVRDHEHSHEALANLLAHVKDLADVQEQINEGIRTLEDLEKGATAKLAEPLRRASSQRDRLAVINAAIEERGGVLEGDAEEEPAEEADTEADTEEKGESS